MTRQSTIEIETSAEQKGKTWNGEEIRRSIVLYKKVAANWEKLGDFKRASFCLRESVQLSFIVSEQKDTLKLLEKALRFDLRENNIDGQVITHSLLFRFHNFYNQTQKSEIHIKSAIKLSNSASNYANAFSHFIAGKNLLYDAEIIKATEKLNSAYIFIEKEEDANLKAEILLNLGMLTAIAGDKDEGIRKINEAKHLWESAENKRALALVTNALAFVYVITDDQQKALGFYKQTLEMIPDDVDYDEKAQANSGISAIYHYYNFNELAEQYQKLAINLFNEGDNSLGNLGGLSELGRIQHVLGKTFESNATFEKATNLANKIGNDYYKGVLKTYTGIIDLTEGKVDTAIEKFNEVKSSNKKIGINLPRIDNLLGASYERKGDVVTALKHFETAVLNSEKTKDTLQLAEACNSLARILKKEGRIEEAYNKSQRAIQLTETFTDDVDNNNHKESYFAGSFERYDLFISLLMELHKSSPQKGFDVKALQASEKSRSRVMRGNLRFSLNNNTIDADSETIAKEQELIKSLNSKSEELAKVVGQKNDEKDIDRLNLEITQIEDDLNTIQAILRQDSPIYSVIKNNADLEIEKFQDEFLDEQTVLLEFFFGKENSYVWLIKKNQIYSYSLPKSGIIENKVDSLLKLLISIEDIPNDDATEYNKQLTELETNYWSEAKELSKILFGQFYDELKDKRLIIVPDGKLRSFPISALPTPNDEEITPFLLTNEIVYEPSASLLYLLKTIKNQKSPPQKDFLVFTDPIFDQEDERLETQVKAFRDESLLEDESPLWTNLDSQNDLDQLTRLFASKKEANNIFQYYNRNNSKVITGFEANRNKLLSENLQDYKVLHFATHGLFNEEVPELSGIVLSRFDEKGEKQNGLIWLQDIYGMRLSSDLVVLSACHTGVGKEIKGEGLMSLTNGFLQVGAKSIVSSHWKVDDDRTSALMENFYKILAEENITPSKALQKAKIKMYQNPNNKFPFYWASFTFHGDFQNKPSLHTNFDYSKYLIFISLVIGLFIIISIVRNKLN